MGERVALWAEPLRLREAMPRWVAASFWTAAGTAGVLFAVRNNLFESARSASDRAWLAIFLVAPILFGLRAMWDLAKASGRILPLAWILVDGRQIRLVTPALRNGMRRDFLMVGQPIDAYLSEQATGSRTGGGFGMGSTRHVLTLMQPGRNARCSGSTPVSDESFEQARRMLAMHGCALERMTEDELYEAFVDTESAEYQRNATPAPRAPATRTIPVEGGELTLVPLGPDAQNSVGELPPLLPDAITEHFVGIPLPGATRATVTMSYEAPERDAPATQHDFKAWTEHLVFVDEVAGDPCHVYLEVPVRGVDVYIASQSAAVVTLHLLAADASAAAQ